MSQGTGSDHLGEAPSTDGEHLGWVADFAGELSEQGQSLSAHAEGLREHIDLLLQEVNLDDTVMAGLRSAADRLEEAAEHLSGAAQDVTSHAQDYEATYGDVREVMQRGIKVPGQDPNNDYWKE